VAETQRRDGASTGGMTRTELEARMVVLEIIAMTSLALALDTSDNGNSEQARGIASLIQDTVRHRCREFGLGEDAQRSADAYADELLSTALLSLYPR
jgi:hypothetical protein